MKKSLDDLRINEISVIIEILPDELSLRLTDIGFFEGQQVMIEHVAPFGKTISVRVGNSTVSLRSKEAKLIIVE